MPITISRLGPRVTLASGWYFSSWNGNPQREWTILGGGEETDSTRLRTGRMWHCGVDVAWSIVVVFPTSSVIDGVCYPYAIWKNQTARIVYFFFNFLSFYAIILFIFMFCYWRIVLFICRQAKFMASHAASASNAAPKQYNQIQANVTKTMILVSACYAIAWLPSYVRYMIKTLNPNPTPFNDFYYGFIILAYCTCV